MTQTPRRFQYNFSVTGRGVYDDNINISSFNRMSDYYFAIEPTIFLGFGGSAERQFAQPDLIGPAFFCSPITRNTTPCST